MKSEALFIGGSILHWAVLSYSPFAEGPVSAFQRFRFLKVTEAPAENATAGAGWGGDPASRFATTAGQVRLRAARLRRDEGPGAEEKAERLKK